jgi:hypothetical protein
MILLLYVILLTLFIVIKANNNDVVNIINSDVTKSSLTFESSSKISLLASSTIPYTITQSAPAYNSGYAFSNIASTNNVCWLGPDRQGGTYAWGGDPSFYFILDLSSQYLVESLKLKQCSSWKNEYAVNEVIVSMSNDGTTYGSSITLSVVMSTDAEQTQL